MAITTKAQADIRRKRKVLSYVKEFGNVSRAVDFLEYQENHITNGKGIMILKVSLHQLTANLVRRIRSSGSQPILKSRYFIFAQPITSHN